jgi:hypothetical protein
MGIDGQGGQGQRWVEDLEWKGCCLDGGLDQQGHQDGDQGEQSDDELVPGDRLEGRGRRLNGEAALQGAAFKASARMKEEATAAPAAMARRSASRLGKALGQGP